MSKHLKSFLIILSLCISIASCTVSFISWQKLYKSNDEIEKLNNTVAALSRQLGEGSTGENLDTISETDILTDHFVSVSVDDDMHEQGTELIPKLDDCVGEYYGVDIDVNYAYLGYHDNTFIYHLRNSDALIEVCDDKVISIKNVSDANAPVLVHSSFAIPRIDELYRQSHNLDVNSIYKVVDPKTDNPDSYTLVDMKTDKEFLISLD